jgi:zinc and cadmium transporter
MPAIEAIIILTLIGGVGALAGGILLLLGKKIPKALIHFLVSFAAGALLGTAFFELLPEALHHIEEVQEEGEVTVFIWVILGMLFFYLLDRGIHWFQFHQRLHKGKHRSVSIPLVIFGDSAHNFIDGVAIATTYLVNPAAGLVTTFATIAHELPQEIGDFAILLHEGMEKKKVFLVNLLSAFLSVLGGIIAFFIGEQIEGILPYSLALTTGFFLYIALVHLLPAIHHEEKQGYAMWESIFLVLGVATIWLAGVLIPHP